MSTEFVIEVGADGDNRVETVYSSHTDTASQSDDEGLRADLVRQESTRSELVCDQYQCNLE